MAGLLYELDKVALGLNQRPRKPQAFRLPRVDSEQMLRDHFPVADHSLRTRWSVCAGRHFNKPIWVSTEPFHASLLKHTHGQGESAEEESP
jgi:hypothetical protein